jgi:hypothetical protein
MERNFASIFTFQVNKDAFQKVVKGKGKVVPLFN